MAGQRISDMTSLASLAASGDVVPLVRTGNDTNYKFDLAAAFGGVPTSAALLASGGSALIGYIQSGAAAIARTAQDALRERVSVLDFVPTNLFAGIMAGTNASDLAAYIQSAIDAAPDGANIVFPGVGPYNIGAAGVLVSARTNLLLSGNAVIKFTAQVSQTVLSLGRAGIKFLNGTGCGIDGLKFNGNSIVQASVGFDTCTRHFMRNVEAYSSAGTVGQIMSGGGVNGSFLNCISRNGNNAAGTRGFWLGNLSATEIETNLSVIGCLAYSNTATGIVHVSNGGVCTSNTAYSNGGSGIIFSGANGYASKNITCTANHCYSNAFFGIQSDVSYTSAADLPSNITVTGNTCRLNAVGGIYLANMIGWTVTGNAVSDNTGDGIILLDRCYSSTVSGNICRDTRSGGSRTQTAGISLVSGDATADRIPANNTISNNECINNINYGIYLASVASRTILNSIITGNQCHDNAQGIHIAEATAASITGTVAHNRCFNNSTVDLRTSASLIVAGADNAYTTSTDVVSQRINAQTGTTYTLVLADAQSLVTCSNAAAITLTVPTNASVAFPVGTTLDIIQEGAAAVTVTPAGGVTVNSRGALVATNGQYARVTLTKKGTNTWELSGDRA